MPLFGIVAWFSYEKELVEVLVCVILNPDLPLGDLLILKFFEILANRVVEFLDIFILFTAVNTLRKSLKPLEWLFNTFVETSGPVKTSSNWGLVSTEGSSLVNLLNKDLSLLEDLGDSL